MLQKLTIDNSFRNSLQSEETQSISTEKEIVNQTRHFLVNKTINFLKTIKNL